MRVAFALAAVLLLAGCTAPVDRPGLRAAAVTLETPPSEMYPGLVVRGSISAVDDGLRVQAVARNDGNRTYQVETGCASAWSQVLFLGNDTVERDEPTARCEAFSLRAFGPGEELTYDVTWDGRVWNGDLRREVKAQPGEYTWSIRFVAYPPDAFAAKRFDLDFDVTVLAD